MTLPTYLNSGYGSAMNTVILPSRHDQTGHHSLPLSIEGKTVRTPTRCITRLGTTIYEGSPNAYPECKILSEGDLPGLTTPAL